MFGEAVDGDEGGGPAEGDVPDADRLDDDEDDDGNLNILVHLAEPEGVLGELVVFIVKAIGLGVEKVTTRVTPGIEGGKTG